jgi:uncharacterized protein YdhG (YjbR/CyaY superfamily)
MDTVEEYLDSLPEPARTWVSEFVDDTAAHYPSVPPVMFRQRPMFKFGSSYQQGYVMFTAAKAHFTVHSVEFELIEQLKTRLPRAGFGKGSVKVRFTDEAAKPALFDYVARVMDRHGIPRV